ncbi:hypothetical protein BpHYR1_042461 [Brachionus plicatilis]|uniref:Uncharacterized protein n=1 Tax=Brachionus plicatilis TaxID=10195 RepID=A0A3M7S6P5_BRAPC|nr:hypothetical protein BpHYR1_042461 [Brachionus plicatilis]
MLYNIKNQRDKYKRKKIDVSNSDNQDDNTDEDETKQGVFSEFKAREKIEAEEEIVLNLFCYEKIVLVDSAVNTGKKLRKRRHYPRRP